MQSNLYTVGFAAAVTVICSVLLSGVSGVLKDRQEINRTVDRQRNILVALGFPGDELKETAAVQEAYKSRVTEAVISGQGQVLDGKKPSDLPKKVATGETYAPEQGLPLYSLKSKADPNVIDSYAYPATGKGLWSTLYGYIAVKPDGNEIVGLSFYKHGETPGLGANIEKEWFRDNFIGKDLYSNGKLVGVQVVKGKVADQTAPQEVKDHHMVDGMSGATITGNGVGAMMKKIPARYGAFFKGLAKGGQKAAKAIVPATPPPATPSASDALRASWKALADPVLAKFDTETKSAEALAVEKEISAHLEEEHIEFATGKATLSKIGQTHIDFVMPLLAEHKSVLVRIDGHTDNTGKSAANHKLAQARADAVKGYLVKNGINKERVFTYGFGEERPVADNATPLGREKNRRIEFKVTMAAGMEKTERTVPDNALPKGQKEAPPLAGGTP